MQVRKQTIPSEGSNISETGVSFPIDLNDGNLVGAKVRVHTQNNEETYDGVIFTMDPIAQFLILEDKNTENPVKSKTRIFQMEALKKIELLEKASGEMIPSLPAITEDELLRMEQKNKIIAERALASIGKGVSTEAQGIFDALNKTMPCEWEGTSIRVMGDVLIKAPYQIQSCSSSNAQVLSRVKKVLEGELRKLKSTKK